MKLQLIDHAIQVIPSLKQSFYFKILRFKIQG
jgi:hypothetical protein